MVTHRLNQKNKANVVNAGVDLYDAKASFVSNKVIKIVAGEDSEQLTADTIVINTGAISNRLPIPGLKESKMSLTALAFKIRNSTTKVRNH